MPGIVPFFRLYKHDYTHFYTTSAAERAACLRDGWTDEGVTGYLTTDALPNTAPLMRFIHPSNGEHFYMLNILQNQQWISDLQSKYGYAIESPDIGRAWIKGGDRLQLAHAVWVEGAYFCTTNPGEIQGIRNAYMDVPAFWVMPPLVWTHKFKSIDYANAVKKQSNAHTLDHQILEGNTDYSRTVTLSGTKSSTFSWGLTEGIHYDEGVSITVGAEGSLGIGIPDLGDVGGKVSASATESVNWGLSVGSNQEWTRGFTQDFTDSLTVDHKANTVTDVTLSVAWYDEGEYYIPFTLNLTTTCTQGGLPLSGAEIQTAVALLQPGLKVTEVQPHSVVVCLDGKAVGSVAMDGTTVVNTT